MAHSKSSLEQRITLRKTSLQCIFICTFFVCKQINCQINNSRNYNPQPGVWRLKAPKLGTEGGDLNKTHKHFKLTYVIVRVGEYLSPDQCLSYVWEFLTKVFQSNHILLRHKAINLVDFIRNHFRVKISCDVGKFLPLGV